MNNIRIFLILSLCLIILFVSGSCIISDNSSFYVLAETSGHNAEESEDALKKIEDLKKLFINKNKKIKKLKETISKQNEIVKNYKQNINEYQKEIKNLTTTVITEKKKRERIEKKYQQIQGQLKKKKELCSKEKGKLIATINSKENKINDLINNIKKYEINIDKLTKKANNQKKEIVKLNKIIEKRINTITVIETKVDLANKKIELLEKEISKKNNIIGEQADRLSKLKKSNISGNIIFLFIGVIAGAIGTLIYPVLK
jgi:chromosome segregation ATPase